MGGGEEGQWLKTVPTVVQSKSVALLILIGYLYTHAPSAQVELHAVYLRKCTEII